MSDIPTEQTMLRFDQILTVMKMKVGDNSPIKQEADIVRDYYRDRAAIGVEEAIRRWDPRFNEFYQARITLERVTAAVSALSGTQGLKALLKDILGGSVTQDFKCSSSKDKLYELEMAATLRLAGFSVELREPDIVASGNGLSKPLAIACKYPFSRQQVRDHISKGYRQITSENLDGVVSIGLDLLVAKDLGLGPRLDFRRSGKPAHEIMADRLDMEFKNLEVERKDYPEERELDGLMLTLAYSGIDGNPPELTTLYSIALGRRPSNPLKSDLGIVKAAIESIKL